MNIALIAPCCLSRDRVGNAIQSLIRGLILNKHRVTLIHGDPAGADISTPNPLPDQWRYMNTGDGILDYILRLQSNTENLHAGKMFPENFYDYDLFIFEYVFHYELLQLASTVPPEKLVFHYHGITPPEMFKTDDPYYLMAKDALARHHMMFDGRGIIVHSNYMKEWLSDHCPYLNGKIHVVPISVSEDFRAKQRRNSPPQSPFHLLYTGRISGNKNVDILLKALRILKDSDASFQTATLTLAGAHSRPTCKGYENDILKLIDSLDLEDNIIWVSDSDDTELADVYRKSDLFVTASTHEGFCIPVAEALSCGVPCVCADVSATPETMGSGGVSFQPDSPQSCAQAIATALEARTWTSLHEKAIVEKKRFTDQKVAECLCWLPVTAPEKEQLSRDKLLNATNTVSTVYSDSVRLPFGARFVKWLRRKGTLPLEVSLVRPFCRKQSEINKAIAAEISALKADTEKLKKALKKE